MKHYWTAPELWPGETAVILGGGPSLTEAQVRHARASGARIIAINDAWRLAWGADVLYFCDDKWWEWHHKKLAGWPGIIVRLHAPKHDFGDPRIKVLRRIGKEGMAPPEVRDGICHGQDSGYQAINLAVLLGARRIVLLGIDMHAPLVNGRPKLHWFGDHPGGTAPGVFASMLVNYPRLADELKKRGIEVVNCAPGSKLTVFPMMKLEDALPLSQAAAA